MGREYSGFVSRVGGWSVWGRTHMVASGVAAEEPELCSVLGLSVDGYTACEHRLGCGRGKERGCDGSRKLSFLRTEMDEAGVCIDIDLRER
ncbi:hypothetical protein PVL29_015900 [Vitis rotundifolia]|uniref:Uncharacterized protein n=1 Tax=Vitis rotundifolia TaxID=103349 RepID=A0AA38ZEY9_VITRO|nr:hypothetical protein PVL29_015900 [Vitis rotundifolia]